jgi:predicted RNA polymerase sigma factor
MIKGIDPRIAAQADECTNPKQTMSRTNESDILGKPMNSREGDAQACSTAEAVARRSYGKLVAFLAARTRDVAAAEDALSEAFASALADWPLNGCPSNPEAWLLTVARRKTIDVFRRRRTGEIAAEQLQVMAEGMDPAATDAEIPDRRLALMFVCAHPAIDAGIRAPLILQVVLGLDAKTIASAFLMSPAAMGKRLVRVKDKIRQAGIPFSVPEREELPGRLDTVLDAIYAAFTEGWSDPGGTDVVRRDLTEEALFLARLVAELLPEQPEALGLLALMLHAEARRRARRNAQGEYVPLADQDPAFWNWQMITEAEALLLRARALGSIGRYQLEGALRTLIAAARVTPTGQRWSNYTMRCWLFPPHQWLPSIAPWLSRRYMALGSLSMPCKRWRPMCGSPNTSPTGRHARSCWRGQVRTTKPSTRTKSQ